jgi:hypothetical protein
VPRGSLWARDANVGDWQVASGDQCDLSVVPVQMPGQAAWVWLCGAGQISSQRPLASWQRRVRMPVAPRSVSACPKA